MTSSIWYWLRDQGPQGFGTELWIKGELIRSFRRAGEKLREGDKASTQVYNLMGGYEDIVKDYVVALVSSSINEVLEYVSWLFGNFKLDEV